MSVWIEIKRTKATDAAIMLGGAVAGSGVALLGGFISPRGVT